MKLLLVDDERYVIESIKKNICWASLRNIYLNHLQKEMYPEKVEVEAD